MRRATTRGPIQKLVGDGRSLDRHGEGDRKMQSTKNYDYCIEGNRLAEFPALASLRLTADELEELANQGFVSEERRGHRTYYKLRFRCGGKQVVRYIGSADRAAIVNEELSILQTESKIMGDLKATVRLANRMLREAKRTMEPVLNANGFVFHGLAIRRPRRRQNAITTNANS